MTAPEESQSNQRKWRWGKRQHEDSGGWGGDKRAADDGEKKLHVFGLSSGGGGGWTFVSRLRWRGVIVVLFDLKRITIELNLMEHFCCLIFSRVQFVDE